MPADGPPHPYRPPADGSDVSEAVFLVPGGAAGGDVPVRIIRPADTEGERLPAVLFLPGAQYHGPVSRAFALGADAAVVVPEHPIDLEGCLAVATWLADHGAAIGVDGSRLAGIGNSAGGNLLAALTILAKKRGGPRFVFQVLLYPVITSSLSCELSELTDLPPALVITAEADAARFAAEAYAARLSAADVAVTCVRYLGVVRGFPMFDEPRDTSAARAAMIQATDTLHVALHAPARSK